MKNLEKEEIEEGITKILSSDCGSGRRVQYIPDLKKVVIRQMYGYAKLTFAELQKISDFLGTEEINISDKIVERGGCGTCQYGSSYAVFLTIGKGH